MPDPSSRVQALERLYEVIVRNREEAEKLRAHWRDKAGGGSFYANAVDSAAQRWDKSVREALDAVAALDGSATAAPKRQAPFVPFAVQLYLSVFAQLLIDRSGGRITEAKERADMARLTGIWQGLADDAKNLCTWFCDPDKLSFDSESPPSAEDMADRREKLEPARSPVQCKNCGWPIATSDGVWLHVAGRDWCGWPEPDEPG